MVAEGDADVIGAEIADTEVEVVASFIGNDGSACAVRVIIILLKALQLFTQVPLTNERKHT